MATYYGYLHAANYDDIAFGFPSGEIIVAEEAPDSACPSAPPLAVDGMLVIFDGNGWIMRPDLNRLSKEQRHAIISNAMERRLEYLAQTVSHPGGVDCILSNHQELLDSFEEEDWVLDDRVHILISLGLERAI